MAWVRRSLSSSTTTAAPRAASILQVADPMAAPAPPVTSAIRPKNLAEVAFVTGEPRSPVRTGPIFWAII